MSSKAFGALTQRLDGFLVMQIVADENIPQVSSAFQAFGSVTTLNGRAITAADCSEADLLLVRSVTTVDESLLAHSRVQFVASATSGCNHIDLDYLSSRNIGFAHAPGSNAQSVADYVIAAICFWAVHEDKLLTGLSIGIVGYGHVGRALHKCCSAMGISCVINDPPLTDLGHSGLSSLDEALSCDIVSLHVPLIRQGPHTTTTLINSTRIAALSSRTLFINTSRGEVVEEDALLWRMQTRADLSVVMDVWENEPDISKAMLSFTMLGTAHIAGYSLNAKQRGTQMIYKAYCHYKGCEPSWSPMLATEPVNNISLTDKDHTLAARVLHAYDIAADSDRLKAVLFDEQISLTTYFDELRRTYPTRFEYTQL
jgi:erythronate-4-phosphate dehydrogenase